jgi:hypothetical protein
MKKAFDEGWGAVIAKTVSLDCSKVQSSFLHGTAAHEGRAVTMHLLHAIALQL